MSASTISPDSKERLLDRGAPEKHGSAASRDSCALDAIEAGEYFPVACGSFQSEACIQASGSFQCIPKRKASGQVLTCSQCHPSDAADKLEVPGADIVGATCSGCEFVLWHTPIASPPDQEHKRRKLVKLEPRTCESEAAAQRAVQILRELNCWWGRDRAPKLLVFINPVSGPGRARAIWRQECLPILEAAGLELQVVETERQKHALEEIQGVELGGVDAIVCAGGDGTMSEIVQGLFQRSDAESAIKTPLCMIPGGTGNGMAASAGLWTPVTAAHALCKGALRRMDILSIFQPPSRRYFSFLSLTFGFIANVDIGTEHLRWMGSFRNQVGAALEILKSRDHRADLAVVPSSAAPGPSPQEAGSLQTPLLDRLGPLQNFGPLANAALPELQILGAGLASCSHVFFQPSRHFCDALSGFGLHPDPHGEGRLRQSPWEALKVMLKADAGKIAEVDSLGLEKIAAFVLEPLSEGTWLVMDGEVLPYKRVFAEIHPGLCNVLVAPN